MNSISKKLLFLLAPALILSLVAVSGCSKDSATEPEQDASLVNSWRLTTVTLKDTQVGDIIVPAAQFLELSGTGAKTSTLEFKEDGTVTLTTTYDGADDDVVPGTWSKDGNKLIITGAGIDDTVPYDIDGNTLTLTIILPIAIDPNGPEEDTDVEMKYTKL